MIEDAPIVKDIRKIRCAISQQFDDDPDRYIDYLLSQQPNTTNQTVDTLKTAVQTMPQQQPQVVPARLH